MAVRIGIMGFGRLGRNMYRIAYNDPAVTFAAVSDLADAESLRYLLKFSTIEGPFGEEVQLDGPYLVVGRQRTRVVRGTRPGDIPWDVLGADIVIESTGVFRRRADLQRHLDAGAKRVILSTPAVDPIDRMIISGVNDDALTPQDRIISGGSSSCHALALILKVLDEKIGVRRAVMTLNVPVPAGSNIDLVSELAKPYTAAEVNAVMKEAAEGPYKGLIEYTDEPIVSSDVVGSTASAVFDAQATLSLNNGLVKTIAWYDNGWGFAHRMVELAKKLAGMFEAQEVAS
jgi:glyceraldehyde 3-phosphate dehydrogenase